MSKTDLRIIKTKNGIYNALLDLMREKQFEEIKVSDICDKALINRSTFYAHFEDKYELLASYIKEMKESLAEELKKNKNITSTKEYYIEMIRLFLNHIESKKDMYVAMAINNRNGILTDIVSDAIDHDIIYHLEENDNKKDVPNSIIAKFYLGAVVNVALYWVNNINKYTKEEMIEYLSVLIPD